MSTMKAIVYCSERSSGVKLAKLPIPKLNKFHKNQVLCKVKYGSLNPVDTKNLTGDKIPEFFHPLWNSFLDNHICGIDFSGSVVDTTPESNYKIGDRICGTSPITYGSFAEYIIVPESTICHIPDTVSDEQAAASPLVGLTILQSFHEIQPPISSSSHVLVIGGSGGTGHIAVQYCKSLGAIVTAICSDKNVDMVKQLGADYVISYQQSDASFFQQLHTIITASSTGGGYLYDIIYDTVTSKDIKDQHNQYISKLLTPQDYIKKHKDTLHMYPSTTTTTTTASSTTHTTVTNNTTTLSKEDSVTSSSIPTAVSSSYPTYQFLKDSGRYINLGGNFIDWINAFSTRYLHLNAFPRNHYLFWVKFPNSSLLLQEFMELLNQQKIHIHIDHIYACTEEDIDIAFNGQRGRRVRGKLLIDMTSTTTTSNTNEDTTSSTTTTSPNK